MAQSRVLADAADAAVHLFLAHVSALRRAVVLSAGHRHPHQLLRLLPLSAAAQLPTDAAEGTRRDRRGCVGSHLQLRGLYPLRHHQPPLAAHLQILPRSRLQICARVRIHDLPGSSVHPHCGCDSGGECRERLSDY